MPKLIHREDSEIIEGMNSFAKTIETIGALERNAEDGVARALFASLREQLEEAFDQVCPRLEFDRDELDPADFIGIDAPEPL